MIAKIFHFLGSVTFALILIATTALFVVTGTFLESASGSHRYAAHFTYSSPLFSALLWGFFLNILLSALRRWPFQRHHIPFLITHTGLLMILGGVLIKHRYGVQGAMRLSEGSGSHEILLPETQAILVEARDPNNPQQILKWQFPLEHTLNGQWRLLQQSQEAPDLELISYIPHTVEKQESWFKGNYAILSGLTPLPLDTTIQAPLTADEALWTIQAKHCDDWVNSARQAYLRGLRVRITSAEDQQVLLDAPLESLPFTLNWEKATLTLQHQKETIQIPLQGPDSLIHPHASVQVDLIREPTLLLLQDKSETCALLLFDAHGRLHRELSKPDQPSTTIAYDRGFGGYTLQAQLPHYPFSRAEREQERLALLAEQLKAGLQHPHELSPPLRLLYQACKESGTDFVPSFLTFLNLWDRSSSTLFPIKKALPAELDATLACLDWQNAPERQACLWVAALVDLLEPSLKEGIPLQELLQQHHWPLSLQGETTLHTLAQQIFTLADQLPPLPLQESSSAHLFSAFLFAYGLELRALAPTLPPPRQEAISLETPLTLRYIAQTPSKKLEENRPLVTLKTHQTTLSLRFDPTASGLKWPLLNGTYRLRFQPQLHSLPYHVRLRQARQISYASSSQAYSYESDLLLHHIQEGHTQETTISMNNVHESPEGYRFYLAAIAPPHEEALKQIQLVVNYDPAKYWLTYPGGLILSLGILLFIRQKKLKT